jgi:hypothetical protein
MPVALVALFHLTLAGPLDAAPAAGSKTPTFDQVAFDAPVDNVYFPLVPGTTYIYEAVTPDGIERDEFTVTFDTKVILGVPTHVIHDVATIYVPELDETFLLEETLDWYFPDNDGNVWYFGEATIAYEYDADWNLIGTSTAGSWEAGVDGAEPGILVLANPKPGVTHQQEFYQGVAEDVAKVLRLNARVSLGIGDFDNVLKTKEWTRLEPGHVGFKYYAPNVGLVLVEELKGKTVKFELVEIIVAP